MAEQTHLAKEFVRLQLSQQILVVCTIVGVNTDLSPVNIIQTMSSIALAENNFVLRKVFHDTLRILLRIQEHRFHITRIVLHESRLDQVLNQRCDLFLQDSALLFASLGSIDRLSKKITSVINRYNNCDFRFVFHINFPR